MNGYSGSSDNIPTTYTSDIGQQDNYEELLRVSEKVGVRLKTTTPFVLNKNINSSEDSPVEEVELDQSVDNMLMSRNYRTLSRT